jgi:hypothetical protein
MRRVRIWARLVIDKDAELTLIVEEAVAEVPVAITCEEKQQKLNECTCCQIQEPLMNHKRPDVC